MLDGASLLVNTTSLGMKGQPPLDLDLARLPADGRGRRHRVRAARDRAAGAARARGNACIDGLGMLLHQGRMGFEAWFGRKVEVTEAQRQRCHGGMSESDPPDGLQAPVPHQPVPRA